MTTAIETRVDTVPGMLDAALAARPEAYAVRDVHGRWTYAELDRAADACAEWLARQGVGAGDRVVARLGNSREFLALMFGTLRLGATFVPLNREMKAYHLRHVIDDAQPRVVVADDASTVADVTPLPVWPTALLTQLVDAPGHPRHRGTGIDPDDLALLIYTSGSTSVPKAVMSTHRPVLFAAQAIAARLRYRHDDVVLVAIPLAFDYGLYQVFLSILAGAELVLTEPSAHVGLISTMHRYGVTVVPIVPSLGDMLVRLAARDARPAPPVRMFTNTGAALTGPLIAALRRSFPHAAVYAMFGITECKRVSIAEPDVDLLKPGSCGTPLDGTEVLILDDAGRVQPPGEPGEIVVRGPHVMSGYWRAPDLSRERFRRDPATGRPTLYTGDFGYLDADGHLYFLGRRDDMFKRRGVRLGALEVEAAARDVPGVRDAALLPPTDGHDMVLFAVVEPDSGLDAAGLAHRLGERLEKAKVPADCRLLPELPLTPNGKTDKRRLGTLVPAGQED